MTDDFLAARRARMPNSLGIAESKILDNPERRHEPDGIGCIPNSGTRLPNISEAANLALELVDDLCNPEAYGHAVPIEVVKRAGRIRAMLRPQAPQTGPGYTEPPPTRCEFCDSE